MDELCFSITATGELKKPITICMEYTASVLAAADGNAARLRLGCRDDAGNWQILSTTVNETAMTVCASVSHLSDFAVLAGPVGRAFLSIWWPMLSVVPVVLVGLSVYWLFFASPQEGAEDEEDEEEEEEEEDGW